MDESSDAGNAGSPLPPPLPLIFLGTVFGPSEAEDSQSRSFTSAVRISKAYPNACLTTAMEKDAFVTSFDVSYGSSTESKCLL